MIRKIIAAAFVALLPATAIAESNLTIVASLSTGWVRNFNPFNETTRLHSVRDFVYEPLVIFNSMHGGTPNFRLATDYNYSGNLLKLSFRLRDGVLWSDGQPFSARDVVFTFEMLRKRRELDTQNIWDRISSVEATDPNTVVFTLKRVNTNIAFEIVRVPIVPEHIWSKIADPVTFTNDNPVGSGPMTEVRRFTSQIYQQCRNPHYWDTQDLKIDCISFPQVGTNEQLLTAAAAGAIDWFGAFLPDIERTYVAADPAHFRYWFPPGGTVAININFDSPTPGNRAAFRTVNFRRAVSMAIDRRAIVDIAGYGYPTVNEYASGLGRTYQSWTDQEAEKEFGQYAHFDKDAARALLAESAEADHRVLRHGDQRLSDRRDALSLARHGLPFALRRQDPIRRDSLRRSRTGPELGRLHFDDRSGRPASGHEQGPDDPGRQHALRAALFKSDLVRVRHQALQGLVQQRQSGRPARRVRRHAGAAAASARARAGQALSHAMSFTFIHPRIGPALRPVRVSAGAR